MSRGCKISRTQTSDWWKEASRKAHDWKDDECRRGITKKRNKFNARYATSQNRDVWRRKVERAAADRNTLP